MAAPLLVSVADIRARYFHGVKILNTLGEELPDEVFEFYIRAAQAKLESYLDIPLVPVTVVDEGHDFQRTNYRAYGILTLYKGPIRSVEAIRLRWQGSSSSFIEFPLSWATWNPASTTPRLQLVPQADTFSGALLFSSGNFLPLLARGGTPYVPDIFRVSYTAGLDLDTPDYDLLQAIGLMAAIGPFDIAGDLIAGAGIASKSMSIPGLSQSISTTSSATNSGYGSRILSYQNQLKQMLPLLRNKYGRTFRMVVA